MSRKRNRRGRGPRREDSARPDLAALFFEEGNTHQESTRRTNRTTNTNTNKTMQMCRQVQRRLDLALGGALDDPVLQGLWVHGVIPEPGGRALLVEVVVDDPTRADDVRRHLDAASGRLRSEVAAAIHRKRTPQLHFVVLPAAGLARESEQREEDDDAQG